MVIRLQVLKISFFYLNVYCLKSKILKLLYVLDCLLSISNILKRLGTQFYSETWLYSFVINILACIVQFFLRCNMLQNPFIAEF